jgi:hypothetical protein
MNTQPTALRLAEYLRLAECLPKGFIPLQEENGVIVCAACMGLIRSWWRR